MAKLREGQTVIFTFNGVNRIGTIEDIKIVNKSKRYQCRAEGGKLYPHLGVNTSEPGKINLPLTEKYFASKEDKETQIGSEGEQSPEPSEK